MEAAQYLAEIKNLIRQRYDNISKKIPLKVLTVFVFKRIVRFFDTDKVAVTK